MRVRRPVVLGAGEDVREQDREHDLPGGLRVRPLSGLSAKGDQEEGADVAWHSPIFARARDGLHPAGASSPVADLWSSVVSRLPQRPEGIPGSDLTGPFPVGVYAAKLRERLREFSRVQVFGELFGFKAGHARVWFELRDGRGALPCSMWRKDWDALGLARARRRHAGGGRGRVRLLPGLAHQLAVVLLRGHGRAGGRRG